MTSSVRAVIVSVCCYWGVAGCSGGGGNEPVIVRAGGTVTFKGAPLAGATVTFLPDKGPLAIGITDLKGEFKLNTGAFPGCAVGPVKVAVSVTSPDEDSAKVPMTRPKTAAESEEYGKKMAEATLAYQERGNEIKKSLIPEKYKDALQSGLSFTVDADKSKNVFNIELKD